MKFQSMMGLDLPKCATQPSRDCSARAQRRTSHRRNPDEHQQSGREIVLSWPDDGDTILSVIDDADSRAAIERAEFGDDFESEIAELCFTHWSQSAGGRADAVELSAGFFGSGCGAGEDDGPSRAGIFPDSHHQREDERREEEDGQQEAQAGPWGDEERADDRGDDEPRGGDAEDAARGDEKLGDDQPEPDRHENENECEGVHCY